MKNQQKGSMPIIIISIIVVIIIAAVVFSSQMQTSAPLPTAPIITTPVPSAPPAPVVSTPVQPTKPVTQPKPVVSTPTPSPAPVSTVPTVTSVSPLSGSTGITATLTGTGFSSTANTVLFAGGPVINSAVTNGGTVLTFTVPSSVGADCQPNQPCPMYARLITNGSYTVAVRNANGTSNSVMFTVTGSGVTSFQPQ